MYYSMILMLLQKVEKNPEQSEKLVLTGLFL